MTTDLLVKELNAEGAGELTGRPGARCAVKFRRVQGTDEIFLTLFPFA